MMIPGFNWLPIKDGDPRGYALFKRHYSALPYRARPRGHRSLFCGPGEKMVLMTPDCRALFVWRKFIDLRNEPGINCAIFRNEGDLLSSKLILEAEDLAWQRWPRERLYTYVNPRKIQSDNPGYCFKMAGWGTCGITTKGLVVLEKLPVTEGEAKND